jgi:hypothetical protein
MNSKQMTEARSQAYLTGNRSEVARLNVALFSAPRKERTLDEIFAAAKAKAQRKAAK